MKRVAVFVDAGYLFAQGSTALSGDKKARPLLTLDTAAVISELSTLAEKITSGGSLLRIYWYDGAKGNRPTAEQELLAHADNIKLRLGFLNSVGQQKGVDSLIVTDLIELARLGAICDAILLSGDEDVRVGVQIAQNYGVRIHLLGIIPSRGSQSKALLQEADTTSEWDKEHVARFLSIKANIVEKQPQAGGADIAVTTAIESSADGKIQSVVNAVFNSLDAQAIAAIQTHWKTDRGVPAHYDGILLGKCRDEIGRHLTLDERKRARASFTEMVKAKK